MAEAIRGQRTVEVDGRCGLKDVAALYAVFESWRAGGPVALSAVESCQSYAYQAGDRRRLRHRLTTPTRGDCHVEPRQNPS